MTDVTTNYSFYLPTINGDEAAWGQKLNANWEALDTILATIAGLGVGVEEAPTDGQNYVRNGLDNAWNAGRSAAEIDLALTLAAKPTKQFIWAEDMFLPSSGGCAALASKVDDVTHLGYQYLGFSAANQYAHFNLIIPEGWDGDTVQAEVYFSGSNGDINNVRWMIHILHVATPQLLGAGSTDLFPTLPAGVYSQVETNPSAFQLLKTPIADLTLDGTGYQGSILQGAIRRGTDSYTGDGQLVGIMITWVNG